MLLAGLNLCAANVEARAIVEKPRGRSVLPVLIALRLGTELIRAIHCVCHAHPLELLRYGADALDCAFEGANDLCSFVLKSNNSL